jgi:hypothetical protein
VSVQARGHRPGAPVVLATESVQVEGAVARAANIPPGRRHRAVRRPIRYVAARPSRNSAWLSRAWVTFWQWFGAAGVWAAIAVAYATPAGRTWATQMRQAGQWWNRPVVKAGAWFLLACCLLRLWFVVVPVALIIAAVVAWRSSANRPGRERIRRDGHIAEMEADLGITEWKAPPQ